MNTPSTCPHFSLCPGCEIPSDLFNPPIWQEVQKFFGQPLSLLTDGFSHTRWKAKLAVRSTPSGPQIGLFQKNSHNLLPIPHCLVHHPSINQAASLIQQELIRHGISAYSEETHAGILKYIQLFVEQSTHRVQLALVATQPPPDSFCHSLIQHTLWHSIWINHHPAPTNRILSDTWQLISGEPFLWQTINHIPIAFHPGAFAQAHLPLFEKMVQKIATWVHPTDRILELYAGVGAIGLTLPSPHITLVESNPFAHLSFQQCGKNARYLCMDAKEADSTGYDVIIVDPPRKGLDPQLLNKLCALSSGHLIYVSCAFESFQRDATQLMQAGWHLKEGCGYLLFPGTNHVEILARLEKII